MWQVQEQARALRALRQDSVESVMALAGMQVAKDIAKSLIFMPIIYTIFQRLTHSPVHFKG